MNFKTQIWYSVNFNQEKTKIFLKKKSFETWSKTTFEKCAHPHLKTKAVAAAKLFTRNDFKKICFLIFKARSRRRQTLKSIEHDREVSVHMRRGLSRQKIMWKMCRKGIATILDKSVCHIVILDWLPLQYAVSKDYMVQ